MAAETEILPTITELITSGINIAIKTSYQEDVLPDTIQARITDNSGIQDGVSFDEGELLIRMKNHPDHIDYYIDTNGDLILTVNTGDADKYSIDINGDLIYTTIE